MKINCKNKFGNMGRMSLSDSMSYISMHVSLTVCKKFRFDIVLVKDSCNIQKYKKKQYVKKKKCCTIFRCTYNIIIYSIL